MTKWLREVVSAHYYFDPLSAVLADLAILLMVVLGVLLIAGQVHHGGNPVWWAHLHHR